MKTEEILERVYPEVIESRNALAKRRRQGLVAKRRWSRRARVVALILPLTRRAGAVIIAGMCLMFIAAVGYAGL